MTRQRIRTLDALMTLAAITTLLVAAACGGSGGDDEGEIVTNVAVHTGTVTRATLHRWVTAYGRVEPEPAAAGAEPAQALVSAPIAGTLLHIDCAEGQRVAAGSTLFRLDDRVAQVAVRRAEDALVYAEATCRRQQELAKAGGTSDKAMQEAERQRDAARADLAAARSQLDLLELTAPIAGTVIRVDARAGQTVDPSTPLAELVDLQRLVVSAALPSTEAAMVRPGQLVELSEDGALAGKIVYRGNAVDPTTDTVLVRASVPAGAGFAPGRFLSLRVLVDEHADCLAVPAASVVTSPTDGSWLMVVDGDRALRRPVTRGLEENGLVEIAGQGLVEGTRIVTDDAYALPAETGIRVLEP